MIVHDLKSLRDTINATPLTLDEMKYCLGVMSAAYQGRPGVGDVSKLRTVKVSLTADAREHLEVRLSDCGLNRGVAALFETFAHDTDKAISALARMMGIKKALAWPEIQEHWKIGEGDQWFVRERLLEALGACPLENECFRKADILDFIGRAGAPPSGGDQ